MIYSVLATATGLAGAFQNLDFSVMTADLYAIIPIVMVPALTWLGLRKAVSFFLGILRGC